MSRLRPIKFRAWDKKEYEFINIKSFGFLEDGEVWYIQAIDENEQEIDPPYFTGEDDLVIMQYTGLTDKNGKEIYEGDILSTDLIRPYLIVEFKNGAFMYQCHDSGEDYYDFMQPVDADTKQDKFSKVIGNIYENSDLLESNQ